MTVGIEGVLIHGAQGVTETRHGRDSDPTRTTVSYDTWEAKSVADW